jgi:hypothetical protein
MSHRPRTCTNFIEEEQMHFVSHREPRITSCQLLKYITFRKYYICPHRRHFHGPNLAVIPLRNEQNSIFGNKSQAWCWQNLKVQIIPIQPVTRWKNVARGENPNEKKSLVIFLMKAEIKCCSSFETLSSYLLTETYIADSFKEKPTWCTIYLQYISSNTSTFLTKYSYTEDKLCISWFFFKWIIEMQGQQNIKLLTHFGKTCLKWRNFLGREKKICKFFLLLKTYLKEHDVWRNTQVKW